MCCRNMARCHETTGAKRKKGAGTRWYRRDGRGSGAGSPAAENPQVTGGEHPPDGPTEKRSAALPGV